MHTKHIVPISHYCTHSACPFSTSSSSSSGADAKNGNTPISYPTNDNFDDILDETGTSADAKPGESQDTSAKGAPQSYPTETPIGLRPDWVLIGVDDARNVFRLSNQNLSDLTAIHKRDPYFDDSENMLVWYYLRDVWQKSVNIYGEQVVNLWYQRFTKDIDQKVSYEALYGWRNQQLLPDETPLFKWLFSHKINALLQVDPTMPGNAIEGEGLPVVKRAIRANASKLAITFALYMYTASYSLWAETLHATCDFTNQCLLFLSIRLAATDPDFNHPYGYGASRWVVSFLTGSVLFGMGLNAMWGSLANVVLHAAPHALSDVKLGILLCVVSGILDSYSFVGAWREIQKHTQQEKYTIPQYLAHGTDSTSIHVFLEDGTGVVCSLIAGLALSATHYYNYSTIAFDVLGSSTIGACLSSIGLVLMLRNAKLLSGRSVQNHVLSDVIQYIHDCDVVASSHDLKSMIVGMNTCVIKVEVNFNADKIADKHIKTSAVFKEFQDKCSRNDIDSFHDLMMKSCADYQQWLVIERSLLEIGIKKMVRNYGYESVHVDIETY